MSAPEQQTVISTAALQQLLSMAEKAGMEASVLGLDRAAPTIDVTRDIRQLALDVTNLVSRKDIYLHAGEIVTVNAATGETKKMTARRFASWVEEFAKCIAPGSKRMRGSLTPDDAAQILDSDVFAGALRPLEAVHTMILPVRRADGRMEFLGPGYDEESQIYTVDLLPYDMTWTLEQGVAFLDEHGAGYPWSWPENIAEADRVLANNRSWAVQIAAMVGTYCKAMFRPGVVKPMIVYIANQPGTGKSTLVSMVLNAVFGSSATTKTPKDDDKMDSELETVARTHRPYVFFDDIGAGLFSNPLNRFITSANHSGRVMGGNSEVFTVPAVTQVFATGNDIKLSKDLMRRCLAAELFLATEVRGRKFEQIISPQYLSTPEVRAGFLSALCALVRHYLAALEEAKDDPERLQALRRHQKPLESFEDWTGLVGCITITAGYMDPLAAPDLSGGGAEEEDELRELLIILASEAKGNVEFTSTALVTEARTFSLMEGIVGSKADSDPDSRTLKKLGRQLQRWRGRELTDKKGRKFRFGHQRQKRGATYPLTFLEVSKAGPSTNTPA